MHVKGAAADSELPSPDISGRLKKRASRRYDGLDEPHRTPGGDNVDYRVPARRGLSGACPV